MFDPILTSAAEINRVYLVGGGLMLYILFLWNKNLVKKIARWTISLATLAVAVAMLQGLVDGPPAPGHQQEQIGEREPLVKSQYYQDPMARALAQGKSEH